MKLLLDTHIFVWSNLNPSRLSPRAAKVIGDSRNELWISPVTPWEIVYLHRKGRLKLQDGPVSWFSAALSRMPCREATLTHEVALASDLITLPHRDPADAFLAATAKVYDLTLVTADDNLSRGKGYSILMSQ
ncbi:MAG TPA: type II toxin-antitoxin system VapC family toxin [Bryobacteraceae bacterium]|nr:type II toxin-antitoxin system VapC family toxin [Bryobacteraceae bacterium]